LLLIFLHLFLVNLLLLPSYNERSVHKVLDCFFEVENNLLFNKDFSDKTTRDFYKGIQLFVLLKLFENTKLKSKSCEIYQTPQKTL